MPWVCTHSGAGCCRCNYKYKKRIGKYKHKRLQIRKIRRRLQATAATEQPMTVPSVRLQLIRWSDQTKTIKKNAKTNTNTKATTKTKENSKTKTKPKETSKYDGKDQVCSWYQTVQCMSQFKVCTRTFESQSFIDHSFLNFVLTQPRRRCWSPSRESDLR